MNKSANATKSTTKNNRRGSQTIEGALCTSIMFALIFLVLDISFSLYIKSTLLDAARAGVRFAVTGQTLGGDLYMNDSIVKVVQSNAMGFLNGSSGACKVTVSYMDAGGGAATKAAGGYIVKVAITGVQFTPFAALFKDSAPVNVNVTAADVMETCPAAGCPNTANPASTTCP